MATEGNGDEAPGRGRPPFKPTTAQRKQVTELVACGMKQDDMARVIGISTPTLVLHFEEELKTGVAKKRAEVIGFLFKTAKKGNVSAQKKLEEMTRLAAAQAAFEQQPHLQQPSSDQRPAAATPEGKKAQAQAAAHGAGHGTDWDDDLMAGPRAAGRVN